MNKEKPVAWAKRSIITGEINGVSLSENTELKSQTLEPLYLVAPQAADTDKVREAITRLLSDQKSEAKQRDGDWWRGYESALHWIGKSISEMEVK